MKIINDTIYSKGNPVIDFGYYDPRTKQPYSSLQNASQYLYQQFNTIPIGLTICVNENELVEYWWIGNQWKAKATISDVQEVIDNIPKPESISIKNFTVYYQGNNPPSANSIKATYNFSSNILTITTAGIIQNKPNGSNIYYYKGTILSNSDSIIWEGPFREITDQELINQMSVSSTYPLQIYKVSDSQPETPTDIIFTYNNGVVTYTQLNGWSDSIPETTGGKIYVSYNNLILTQNTSSDTPTYNGDMTGWTPPVEYLNLSVLLGDVINTNNEEYKIQREQAIADLENWLSGLSTDIGDAQKTLDEIAAIQQQIDNGQLDLTGIQSNLDNISKQLVTNGWAQYKIYYIKYNNQYICYLNDTFQATTSNTNAVFVKAAKIITGGYYIKQIYQGDTQFIIEDYISQNPVSNTFNFDQFIGVTLEEDLSQSGSFLYSKQVQDALNGEFLTQAAAINPTGSFKTAIQNISSDYIKSQLTSITGSSIKQAIQTIADGQIANTVGELTNDQKVNLSKFLQSPNGITLEALGGNTTINITSWKLQKGPISYRDQAHQQYIESNLRQGYTTIDSNVVRFKPIPYILNNQLQFGQFVYQVQEDGAGTDQYMQMDYYGNLKTGILNSDGELIIGIGTYSATKNSVSSAMMGIIKNRISLSVTSPSNSASFTIGIKDSEDSSYASISADVINLTGQVLANAIAAESLNVNDSTYLLNNGSAAFGKYKTYFDQSGDGYLAGGLISWGSKRLYIYSNSNKTTLLLTLHVADNIEDSETVVLNIDGTEKTFRLKNLSDKWGLININNTSEYAYYDDINKKWVTTSTTKWLDTIYYNGNGLSVKGLINATGGQIGGWTISNNALTTTYNIDTDKYKFTIYPGDTNNIGYMGVTKTKNENSIPQWKLSADGTASFSQGAVQFGTDTWCIGTPGNKNAQILYENGQITIGSSVNIAGGLTANRINISKLVDVNNVITDYAGIDGPTENNNKVIWSGGSRTNGNPTFYVTDEGEIFGSKGTLSVINNNHITDLHKESFNPSSGVYSNFDGFTRYIMNNNSDAQSAVNKLTNFNQDKQVYTLHPDTFYNKKVYIFNPSKVGDVVYLPQGGNTSEYVIVLPFGYAGDGGPSDSYYCSIPYEDLVQCVGRRITLINLDDSYNIIFVSPNNYVHKSQIVTNPDRQLVSTIGTSLITSNPQLTQSDIEIQHNVTYEYKKTSNQSGTSGFFYIEIKYSEYNGLPYIYTELTSSNNPTMVNPTSNQIAVMQ